MPAPSPTRARGPRLAWILGLSCVAMFGLGFAAVPLYTLLCAAIGETRAGAGGVRASAGEAAQLDLERNRTVTIEFDATLNQNFTGSFAPLQKRVRLHPGEVNTVFYRIRNATDHPTVAQAIPGVTPAQAGRFLKKIECFCFSEQALAPSEERDMGVKLVVDPALPPQITTLTLSYTLMTVR